MPPSENPTYIAVDDDTFYLARTTSTQLSVAERLQAIADKQEQIDIHVADLKGAAAQGMAAATKALTTLTTQPLSATLANATPLKDTLTAQAKVAP